MRIERMLLLVIGSAASVLLACTERPVLKSDSAVVARPAPRPADTTWYVRHVDSTELAAIRRSQGVVSRHGDTLIIRLGDGRTYTHVDEWGPEASDYQRYLGTLSGRGVGPDFHMVGVPGESPTVLLMDARSGEQLEIPGVPIVSPDGARFAVTHGEQDICYSTHAFGIWRLTQHLPEREWSAESLVCEFPRGWEISRTEWHSADTVAFERRVHTADPVRERRGDSDVVPSTLVRTPTGWALDSASQVALTRPKP
jgi:hypothetical protein